MVVNMKINDEAKELLEQELYAYACDMNLDLNSFCGFDSDNDFVINCTRLLIAKNLISKDYYFEMITELFDTLISSDKDKNEQIQAHYFSSLIDDVQTIIMSLIDGVIYDIEEQREELNSLRNNAL